MITHPLELLKIKNKPDNNDYCLKKEKFLSFVIEHYCKIVPLFVFKRNSVSSGQLGRKCRLFLYEDLPHDLTPFLPHVPAREFSYMAPTGHSFLPRFKYTLPVHVHFICPQYICVLPSCCELFVLNQIFCFFSPHLIA